MHCSSSTIITVAIRRHPKKELSPSFQNEGVTGSYAEGCRSPYHARAGQALLPLPLTRIGGVRTAMSTTLLFLCAHLRYRSKSLTNTVKLIGKLAAATEPLCSWCV